QSKQIVCTRIPIMPDPRSYLTNPAEFRDVSRGNPRPHSLKGDALVQARLTPETWRLEIVSDGTTQVQTPRSLEKNNAIDFAELQNLGKQHSKRFLKAMQCLNIAVPLGQGLWEGVPLREVIKLTGRLNNIRRIFWWGFHNNDPKQVFQASLSYSQVFETPPWDLGRWWRTSSTASRFRCCAAGRCAWSSRGRTASNRPSGCSASRSPTTSPPTTPMPTATTRSNRT